MWGKLFGTMADSALGGPLSALLATADSQRRGRGAASGVWARVSETAANVAFTVAAASLSARLAQLAGPDAAEAEAQFIRVFAVAANETDTVRRLFAAARDRAIALDTYPRQVAEFFAGKPEVLEHLLAALTRFAAADAPLSPAEHDLLRTIGTALGLAPATVDRLIGAVEG